MKMAIERGMLVDIVECHRLELVHEQHIREERAKAWERIRLKLLNETKQVLILAFVLILSWIVIWHRAAIENLTSQTAAHVQTKAKDSSLRQSALAHEKEVEEASKQN